MVDLQGGGIVERHERIMQSLDNTSVTKHITEMPSLCHADFTLAPLE